MLRRTAPVFIGDALSCFVNIEKVGRASIAVRIASRVRRGVSGAAVKVTEGLFVYVAIDAERKPRPSEGGGNST